MLFRSILDLVPSVEKRVYLLKEFVDNRGHETELDVPDPIGHGHCEYQECLITIKEAVDKIVDLI